ncbi:LysM peptidoglycan-binding domain-containing protein [Candidatus Omnitrophota bacterium]
MGKKYFIITICIICFFFVTIGISLGAERKGIVIPQAVKGQQTTEVVDSRTSRVLSQQPSYAKEEEGFIEVYANEKEIERLKRVIEKRNREIDVLKGKLDNTIKHNNELEVYMHTMSTHEQAQYEVKRGDSLWKIAKRRETYNDPLLWIKLYNANMDRIEDPNLIYPGQILRVPS